MGTTTKEFVRKVAQNSTLNPHVYMSSWRIPVFEFLSA